MLEELPLDRVLFLGGKESRLEVVEGLLDSLPLLTAGPLAQQFPVDEPVVPFRFVGDDGHRSNRKEV